MSSWMKKRKGKRRPAMSGEMELQITSMADIFTILLVFLLKSFATGAVNISPSGGMLLAQAQAAESAVEALKVEISETSVSVEGQPVAKLQKFLFDSADLQGNGSSKELGSALERERKRQLLIAQANTDVKVDPRVVIVADQRVPYQTIKSVLASAALQGYTDFKLAVIQKE